MTSADGGTSETIRNGVELAVNVPHRPRMPALSEALPQVVAILEEDAEMGSVTTPFAIDALHNEHGVQLEDQRRNHRVAQSPTETFTEAVEFSDVVRRRIWA